MIPIYDRIINNTGTDSSRTYLIKPYTIRELFLHYDIIKIPKYQRPYTWEKNNWEDLLTDIHNVHMSPDRTPWFFGSIYLVTKGDNQEAELLDGQQRITTITLLLSEILSVLNKYSFSDGEISKKDVEDLKEQIVDLLVRKKLNNDGITKKVTRFVPETEAIELYNQYILSCIDNNELTVIEFNSEREKILNDFDNHFKKNGTVSIKRIKESILFFHDKIENLLAEKDGYQTIVNYIKVFLHQFWIIQVPINDAQPSIQIFESLNNRGKKLSLSDKIKFKMIQIIDSSKKSKSDKDKIEQSITVKWYRLFKKLDYLTSETDFLKSEEEYFKIYAIAKSKESQLNTDEKILSYLFKNIKNTDNITDFIDELLFTTSILEKMYKRDKDYFNKWNGLIIHQDLFKVLNEIIIKGLRVSDNLRFLLLEAIFRNYKTQDPLEYSRNIWEMIRTVFVEIISEVKSNKIRTKYLSASKSTFQELNSITEDLLKSLNNANNVLFHRSTGSGQREAEFLLYFASLKNHASLIFNLNDHDNTSIEHFIPKKWTKNWQLLKTDETDIEIAINEIKTKLKNSKFQKINGLIFKSLEENLKPLLNENNVNETIIDLIGNKLSIFEKTNNRMKNSDFKTKIRKLSESKRGILPAISDKKIGFQKYINNDIFDEIHVLERSYNIVIACLETYNIDYDNLNSSCNMN